MACCNDCAHKQARGQMARGTTCSPCAAGNCPKPNQNQNQAQTIDDCACPTLMLERIDFVATAQWELQNDDLDAVALLVLESVYPQTPDGRAIDWRNLAGDSALCLLELRRRVRARIEYVFAHHDEEAAEKRWRALRGEL